MQDKSRTAPEHVPQGLSDEDLQYLIQLADNQFTAVVNGIIVPESLDDQKIYNL